MAMAVTQCLTAAVVQKKLKIPQAPSPVPLARVQHPTAVIKLRALKLPMVQVEVTLFVVPDSLSSRTKSQLIVVPLLVLQTLIPPKTMHAATTSMVARWILVVVLVTPKPLAPLATGSIYVPAHVLLVIREQMHRWQTLPVLLVVLKSLLHRAQ